MLKQDRLERTIAKMKEKDIPQMLVSDQYALYYLLDKTFIFGERMGALYINTDGTTHFVINKLFPQVEDLGVEITYYDDVEDGVEILSQYVDKTKTMGIDKTWPSRFLLRLQELGAGSAFVNNACVIDKVRQLKGEDEHKLMKESALLIDKVMDKLIPWVVKGLTEKELNEKCAELCREVGFSGMSFDPITAYGKGGADPHHITDDSKGKHGDSVVLDIGGMWK